MSSPLDAFFQFRLGAEVTHAAMQSPFYGRRDRQCPLALEPVQPQKMYIVERSLTECPGGVQAWYKVRVLDSDDGKSAIFKDLFTFSDLEVIAYASREVADA